MSRNICISDLICDDTSLFTIIHNELYFAPHYFSIDMWGGEPGNVATSALTPMLKVSSKLSKEVSKSRRRTSVHKHTAAVYQLCG